MNSKKLNAETESKCQFKGVTLMWPGLVFIWIAKDIQYVTINIEKCNNGMYCILPKFDVFIQIEWNIWNISKNDGWVGSGMWLGCFLDTLPVRCAGCVPLERVRDPKWDQRHCGQAVEFPWPGNSLGFPQKSWPKSLRSSLPPHPLTPPPPPLQTNSGLSDR